MKAIRSLLALVFLTGGVVLGAARPAPLHLALSKAVPGVDSTVTVAPTSIDLYFTQAPQAKGTSLTLTGANGAKVALAAPKADAKDPKIIRTAITGEVRPGAYTVGWRTMAADGHVVRGEYAFTYEATE